MIEWRFRVTVKQILFCMVSVLILKATPAVADALDEGVAAYERGDYREAIDAWMPLADQGDVDALFNMGQLYRMGKGLSRDPVMAEYFYRQAAEKGHLAAQGNLGTLYYFGFDDSPRVEAAFQWWQKAARGGDPRSQYMIGILYYNGEYLERDKVRAYAWIRRAAVAGLPEAVEAESKLIRALSVKELAAGNNLAPRVHDLPVVLKGGGLPRSSPDAVMASAGAKTDPEPVPDLDVEAGSQEKNAEEKRTDPAPDGLVGYYVQLAALSTRASAEALKGDVQSRMPVLAGDPGVRIEESGADEDRTLFRLLVGGFISREEAALRCARFKESGQDCYVVRR